MREKGFITDGVRKLVVGVLALLFIALSAWSIITTRDVIGRPFPGFLLMKNNVVPIFWLSDWSGFKQGIKFGDLVVAVNGRPVSDSAQVNEIVLNGEPGSTLTFTVKRGLDLKERLSFSIPLSVFTVRDYLLIFWMPMVFGFLIYSLGLTVFYLKPNSRASLAFLIMGSVWGIILASVSEHILTNVNFITIICLPLLGPSILFLGLNFPVEYNYGRKTVAALAGFALALVCVYLYAYLTPGIIFFRYVDVLMQAGNVVLSLSGFVLVLRSFIKSEDPVVRQKGKVVFYGFYVAFLSLLVMLFGTLLLKRVTVLWIVFPITLVTVSIGYAIVKHNLFDADVIIRRSFSYLLVSGIVVILFFVLIGSLSFLLQRVSGHSSQVAAVVSTLLLAMIFRPLRARVDHSIDRRFFREKHTYRETIQKTSEILVSIIELDELLQKLVDTVMDAMNIGRAGILLARGDPPEFDLAIAKGYEGFSRMEILEESHPVVELLNRRKHAVQINDVRELREFAPHRELLLGMMKDLDLVLVIPILYKNELIGIFGLAAKKSGEWYSTEDINMLQTLMNHSAMAIENARKVDQLKKMVALETSYRELKKLDEMKDDFLSMVSHDMRTPMTNIKGYASILSEKQDKFDRKQTKMCLDVIINESDRLTRLINNLLDLQRFEAGRMPLDMMNVDMVKIARDSIESFKGAAYTKEQTIVGELPDEEMTVLADADRLSQVMANLLSNAVKFTPEQGTIKVTVEKIEGDFGPNAVRVTVTDNGPGVPSEEWGKLFDKFHQARGLVPKEKEQGSGLGLALVREIVTRHQGEVNVISEPGSGSSFFFWLPLAADDAVA